jgi:hypothetical protein
MLVGDLVVRYVGARQFCDQQIEERNIRPRITADLTDNKVSESESVAGLEFALIDSEHFCVCASTSSAGCPAEIKVRAKGKDHLDTIELGLQTYAFSGRRKSEVEFPPEDDRIRLTHVGDNCGMEDLSLQ